MRVQEIQSPQIWEQFIQAQPFTLFVQSPLYGEFYKRQGENFFLVGILEEEKLIGGSLVVTTHARRGNFLYLPYGPILPKEKSQEALTLLTAFLVHYAKEQGYTFIRSSPFLDETESSQKLFSDTGYRKAPMHVLAEKTWMLDIQPDEETLLKNMKKNHRNLIRRCEREGVRIVKTKTNEGMKGLHELLDITSKRHNFSRFSRKYIEDEYKTFSDKGHAMLFSAYLPDGTLDAAAIFIYYGTMGVYRHSASLGKNHKIPTSYLLQWEALKEGKKRGMTWHNFWGIAPDGSPKTHPFFGITHFKKGFGGEAKDVLPCMDYPVTNRYYFNWLVETLRRIKRGF